MLAPSGCQEVGGDDGSPDSQEMEVGVCLEDDGFCWQSWLPGDDGFCCQPWLPGDDGFSGSLGCQEMNDDGFDTVSTDDKHTRL